MRPGPRPADRSGQVAAPEPGQVGSILVSTLARCWSEESPTAGHYNCWSWTINTAHTLLPSVDTSAASWQQCSHQQADMAQSSEPLLTSAKSKKDLVDKKNRQLDWHGHVKCSSYVAASSPKCSSDPASITATWQKCSLHSSHLTEVQRAAYKAAIWQKCRLHSSHLAEVQDAE